MLGSQFLGMCIHYLRINRTLHISITLQSTNKVPLINGGTSPFFVWRISAWVDVKEYEKAHPDTIAANGAEQTLKVLNTQFSRPLKELLSVEVEVDDAALISIDSKGVDIRVRQGAQVSMPCFPSLSKT
jgi:hypothetical protein